MLQDLSKKFVKFRKKETILNLKQFRKEPKEIRFRIINNIVKKKNEFLLSSEIRKSFEFNQ